MSTYTYKVVNFDRFSHLNVNFLGFDEFSPGPCQKQPTKPRSCQKLENSIVQKKLQQEKSSQQNQDPAKSWKIQLFN